MSPCERFECEKLLVCGVIFVPFFYVLTAEFEITNRYPRSSLSPPACSVILHQHRLVLVVAAPLRFLVSPAISSKHKIPNASLYVIY